MDLSRAKTVLIAAFLILNLFLLYQFVESETLNNPALFGGQEEVSRLETALQQANLTLDLPLPRGGTRAAHLVVEPWQQSLQDVALMLWQGLQAGEGTAAEEIAVDALVIKVDYENNIRSCDFGPYKLLLNEDGTYQLHNAFSEEKMEQTSTEIGDFVKQVPFLQDFVYDYTLEEEGGTVYYFKQTYEDFPLYAGYLKFSCDQKAGCQVHFYRLEPLGFGEQQREVIPPSTALWRFLEAYTEDEHEPTAIVEFSLGYYSEEYDAQLWEIPPVWRIRLLNEEVFYINAFTGYHEKS